MFISEIGLRHMHIVAPCPHEGMCPMAQTSKDWCRFSQMLIKMPHKVYTKDNSRIGESGRGKALEGEQYSYLVIRKS